MVKRTAAKIGREPQALKCATNPQLERQTYLNVHGVRQSVAEPAQGCQAVVFGLHASRSIRGCLGGRSGLLPERSWLGFESYRPPGRTNARREATVLASLAALAYARTRTDGRLPRMELAGVSRMCRVAVAAVAK